MFIDPSTSAETPVTFKFEYNSDEDAFGFRNESNQFVSFKSGSSIDISDTTATSGTVLSGYDFYLADGSKTSGTIASKVAQTYTPSTTNQTIAAGQYLSGAQTIKGDANLVAANIKSGVSIFGKTGTYTSDANATAKNIESGKTAYVNGVKITGTANVPHTITQITAAMTSRDYYRAGFNDNYVLVAGGCTFTNYSNIVMYNTIDTYNSSLTKSSTTLNSEAANLCSASNNNYTIFNCGIRYYKGFSGSSSSYFVAKDIVNKAFAFNTSLTQSNPTPLSTGSYTTMQGTYTTYKTSVICGSIGQYCIFAGGLFMYKESNSLVGRATPDPVTVECYNSSLSKNTCANLPSNNVNSQAVCSNSTRLFMASKTTYTISYNTSLTQSSHTALSNNPDLGTATVNNFALFPGEYNANVSYYNTSGTLSTTTSLSSARAGMVGVTLPEFALFVGGTDGNNYVKTVDVYNSSLSRSLGQSAAYNHTNGQSAKVGEYGFAIGGLENNIDVFYST